MCVHVPMDSDGDGVLDPDDQCPDSILTPTVVLGTCDSGVPNTLLSTGCTISDLLAACQANPLLPKSKVKKCMKQTLDSLKKQGVITEKQKKAIEKCVKKYYSKKPKSVKPKSKSAKSAHEG